MTDKQLSSKLELWEERITTPPAQDDDDFEALIDLLYECRIITPT